MNKTVIFGVGAASVANRSFHKLCSASIDSSCKIDELAESMVFRLKSGIKVALGYESPLLAQIPSSHDRIYMPRVGEFTPESGNRPTNTDAETSLFAAGIQSLSSVLSCVKTLRPETTASISFNEFRLGTAEMLVWEAFVSGSEKAVPSSHAGDARLVMETGCRVLAIREQRVFSFVRAAVLSARHSEDLIFLKQPALVLRPRSKEVRIG